MSIPTAYEDDSAIRSVIFDYAWAMDTKDWKALAACFTEACEISYGRGDPSLPHPHAEETRGDIAFTNRDDLVAHVSRTHEPILSVHMMGATAVSLESAERATARTYARLVLVAKDPAIATKFESGGVYDDVLRKDDGVWRIAARHYTRLWAEGNADVMNRDGD